MEQKNSKILLYVSLAVIFVAALLSFYVFYQLIFPTQVLQARSPQPLQVEPKEVTNRDTISFLFDYCKNKDVPYDNSVSFINGVVYPSSSGFKKLPIGCHKVKEQVLVPVSLRPGTYHMLIRINYKVNQFVEETHEFQTESFVVK